MSEVLELIVKANIEKSKNMENQEFAANNQGLKTRRRNKCPNVKYFSLLKYLRGN